VRDRYEVINTFDDVKFFNSRRAVGFPLAAKTVVVDPYDNHSIVVRPSHGLCNDLWFRAFDIYLVLKIQWATLLEHPNEKISKNPTNPSSTLRLLYRGFGAGSLRSYIYAGSAMAKSSLCRN
jgi:hypothetical protein